MKAEKVKVQDAIFRICCSAINRLRILIGGSSSLSSNSANSLLQKEMAYAAVASLSQTIHFILNYDSISPELKIPITYVHQNVIFLQSFLEDYPDEADNWEERMRDVTNEAEDIIEILVSNLLLDSTVGSSEHKSKKGNYELRSDLNELERVAEEIESLVKGVKERHRQTAGGFNGNLTEIVDLLCGGAHWREIITIVGRGGIGKTTLARNAYNHPLIVEHFDIRAWVTVSQDYTRRGGIFSFLLNILRVGGRRNTSYSELDKIEYIVKFLSLRKYLIVLDDIGSKDDWNMLQLAFPDSGNGSRIILTSRLPNVVSSYYHHIHEMRSMNVDESWDLLRQKIFEGEPCPPKLEHIGKMIGRSCRGLPLAVEVVAGILRADLTQARWEDIAENMETVVDGDDDEHPLQILSLSYTYLPHHLRPCLLYLGIFPEVHEIRVSKLIKLWVAEGFLNESECKSSEEIGKDYLEELVKGSLVSVVKRRNSDGRVKRVSIHDLVRDFCFRQAKLDNFFLHFTKSPVAAGAVQLPRRVSVADIDNMLENVYGSTIRTMICSDGNLEGIICLLQYFWLLRILDLSEVRSFFFSKWKEFNNQIFEQFHLRYLAFTVHINMKIPKAISKLENLQTLIIRPSLQQTRQLLKLPVEIWRMQQLRHVVVHSCVLPTQKEEEEGMFALENLQTLDEAVNLVCSRHNLEMMPNLKKLCMLYTNFSHRKDYKLYNLLYFQKLEVLKIRTQGGYGISPAFPPTLKRLTLSGLRLPWEDMKIVGLLTHLQELELRDEACVGSKWETSEGGFSQLNFLLIHNSDLEHWITATTHFPVLNCLVLLDCQNLRKVPNDIGRIVTLELIEVDELNASLLGSAKSIQEDQQSWRNHSLQVRAVPIPSKEDDNPTFL